MQSLQADQRNTDLCIRQVYRLIKCIQSSPDIKVNGIILRDEKITNQASGQTQVFSSSRVTNKKSPMQRKRKEREYTFPCFLSMLYSIPQATNYSEFLYERKHTSRLYVCLVTRLGLQKFNGNHGDFRRCTIFAC